MKYTVITPNDMYSVDARNTKDVINYLLEFENNITDFECLTIIRDDAQKERLT